MTETLEETLLKKKLIDEFGYTWADLDGTTKEELKEELAFVINEREKACDAISPSKKEASDTAIDDCACQESLIKANEEEQAGKVLKQIGGGIAIDLALSITKMVQLAGVAFFSLSLFTLCVFTPIKKSGIHRAGLDIGLPLTVLILGICITFASVAIESRLEDKLVDKIFRKRMA